MDSPRHFPPGKECALSSSTETLREQVHARFREAFGAPHATAGGGADWSLESVDLNAARVHVIVTGWDGTLGVWVFDPHDQTNGVARHSVSDVAQIDRVIESIRSRVSLPSAPTNPGSSQGPDAP